jgi:nucleoside-triphosphatase
MASERSGRPGQCALLLTGPPGVGKTTVIRRIAAQLEMRKLRGFYTEEIREGGERRGFRLLGFQGQERIIAHTGFAKSHRVGKYGVDVAAMDEAAALLAPDPAAKAYLVDEIGKMECLSERFVAAMRVLLAGRKPVVATVALRGAGFIAEAKSLPDALVWEVTPALRDELPARVKSWLTEKWASDGQPRGELAK